MAGYGAMTRTKKKKPASGMKKKMGGYKPMTSAPKAKKKAKANSYGRGK